MGETYVSINRGRNKEDVVYIHNGILLSYKKNEVMPLFFFFRHATQFADPSSPTRDQIQAPAVEA